MMQWYTIVAIVYAVGGIIGHIATWRFIEYCRPRSILDTEDRALMEALGMVDGATFWGTLRDVLLWPLAFGGWLLIAFIVWRRRRGMNDTLNEALNEALQVTDDGGDGFDVMRRAHEDEALSGPGITALSVAVTVDGHTGFAHWLTKQKLDELWIDKGEVGEFLRGVASDVSATKPQTIAPRLSLVKNDAQRAMLERALNLAGLCFYAKVIDGCAAPVFLRFPKITEDYMFLPLFKSEGEAADKLLMLGMDVETHNLKSCCINDAKAFLMSCPSSVLNQATMKNVPVRVITNLVEKTNGNWTFDTICEISKVREAPATSPYEGPTSRPPAA